MARVYCTKCRRLQPLCLCDALTRIDNQVEIVFLQHPLERDHIKGTAWLTHLCLQNSRFHVGETFDEQQLHAWLQGPLPTYLLYPDTGEAEPRAVTPESLIARGEGSNCRVVILDGTWKKTRKMLFLNPALGRLPRLQLTPTSASRYGIRKQKNAQSLSSLEATQQLLSALEQDTQKYAPLAEVLSAISRQYESFRN